MKPRVLILGAGLAGLYSAYLLQQKGYNVTIIEARDRVGGRVCTQVIDSTEGLTVELGAEWIGKTHLRMQKLCKQFNLKLVNHELQTHLLYKGKYSKPSQWKFHQEWQKKIKKTIHSFAQANTLEQEKLNQLDWWHFLKRSHVPDKDLDIIDLLESTDYGESIRFTSALEALMEELLGGGTDSECFAHISGGNSSLPQAIAAAVGWQHIHLSQEVRRVHQTHKGISVTSKTGQTWQADAVVCALPIPTLLNIAWEPQFSESQQTAFWSVNYSRIMKTHVLFKDRFWKKENFSLITDQLPHYIYHATQNQPSQKGVLTSYTTGEKAMVFSRMSDSQRLRAITETLQIPFGDIADKVEKIVSYFWVDDPYAQGAYALYEKHLPIQVRKLLSQPHQQVFFCGEHAATNVGFMEGALDSAERVVKEISL